MSRFSGITGSIGAILGFILPSFTLIWTGGESTSMLLVSGYLFLGGYYELDLGDFGSITDSGIHIFNINWYLDPSYNTISQGSGVIDVFLNILAVAVYPGDFNSSNLDISGILFGVSALIVLIGIVLGFILRNNLKISGFLYLIGGVISIISLFFIWTNAIDLTWFGSSIRNNFFPIPLGSLIIIGSGVWNLRKS